MESKKKSWSVVDAKARFSQLIDDALTNGPQVVTRHGQDAVVVVSTAEWRKKTERSGTLVEFFANSPLKDSGVDLERVKSPVRRIDL